MNNQLSTTNQQALAQAGQAADHVASRRVFVDYQVRRSANTLRRQRADLDLFRSYLQDVTGLVAGDFYSDPESWRGITWGLVSGFVQWQLQNGYAVGSINVRLSSIKKYAALAELAGALDSTAAALIRRVSGYAYGEMQNVDQQRATDGYKTRNGAKKAAHVTISTADAKALKQAAETPQSRRDALLMCLALDHGLRCGEIAILKVGDFNLTDGQFTFYRPKVNKIQTHEMTPATRRALATYINAGDCPLAAGAPLLRGSNKSGALTDAGMSERAITKRIHDLGAKIGIVGLSAHDCRHFWATRAAAHGTDPFALQEAGGWNSLAMPRRYVEDAKIANAGVKLE